MIRMPRLPFFFRWIYPKALWSVPPKAQPTVYLTFDDGPHPSITPFVLQELKRVGAQAHFFLIGSHIAKHPEVVQQILKDGHQIGNHTFHHKKGWQTSKKNYLNDLAHCQTLYPFKSFRPPYGKFTWPQYKAISNTHQIILWSLLSYDFDVRLTAEDCYELLINHLKDGDIIVFHDSEKAFPRLHTLLHRFLDEMKKRGFEFGKI